MHVVAQKCFGLIKKIRMLHLWIYADTVIFCAMEVNPDVIGDFRNMQFSNDEFDLVVFDPPHLIKAGKNSWLAKKYGLLDFASWQDDLSRGFNECMRVLKPCGTLIFKWNEEQVKLSEVLKCFNKKPLFGNKRSKTHWLVFVKNEVKENE